MNIKISQIKLGERYRKDMGDLQALADSIKEHGQLQPIGVDSNYRLIFGERRIRACELLGQDKVEGNVIHLKDILKGERDENEVRKDFTLSECVEIGKAIEQELGNRQGQRTDEELPSKWTEVKGKETIEIAAEKSGFNSRNTYSRAKKVTDSGSPELIQKMDNKEVSISAAAKIADFDKEEQEEIIEEINNGAKPAQVIKTKEKQAINEADKPQEPIKQQTQPEPKQEPEQPQETTKEEVVHTDTENPLRIDHLVSLTFQLFGSEEIAPVFDKNLSGGQPYYFTDAFTSLLLKRGNKNLFFKPVFGYESDMDKQIEDALKYLLGDGQLTYSGVFVVELKPSEPWFKKLTEESDYLCLPHQKLNLMHKKGAPQLGGKFHKATVALFFIQGTEPLPHEFEILFGRDIGSVWS